MPQPTTTLDESESIDLRTAAGLTTLSERLSAQLAEREALHRMTPAQRLLRSRRGELTPHQRGVWCANYPSEIPMVNDVPVWIAQTLCDIVDEGEED
jgi:hypothetical protein